MKRRVFPEVSLDDNKWSMDNNMDMLTHLLVEWKWGNLKEEEKTDLAQTVVNIESRFLGLPPIWVKAISLDDIHVISSYCDEPIPLIVLNTNVFTEKNGKKMLNALLHECRHCFQHRLIEIYDMLPEEYKRLSTFHEVPVYKEEFEHYHKTANNSSDDIESIIAYATQLVEVDARLYSAFSEKEYHVRIERYMKDNKEGGE